MRAGDVLANVLWCRMLDATTHTNPQFPAILLFLDEASFTQEGIFNRQNAHMSKMENPHCPGVNLNRDSVSMCGHESLMINSWTILAVWMMQCTRFSCNTFFCNCYRVCWPQFSNACGSCIRHQHIFHARCVTTSILHIQVDCMRQSHCLFTFATTSSIGLVPLGSP